MDDTDLEPLRIELLRVETLLAQRRIDELQDGGCGAVIHEAFREIGASGRLWTRDAVLAELAGAAVAEVALEQFAVEQIAPGVVLATFRTDDGRGAWRASIWVRDGDRWRVRFHQGTPALTP